MALFTVRPANLDETIARGVVSHTNRHVERAASWLTWGADEHVLLTLAAAGWLLTRNAGERDRRLGNHFLACSLSTAILPHIMKHFIDQERPDRLTVVGHLRGIALSGKSDDAFPSGHALHLGALASAATLLGARSRNALWAISAVLVTTRIVLLAHWFTDVAAGLALGAAVERILRPLTMARRNSVLAIGEKTQNNNLSG
jgi:membrane-associated phospholipid phosphatase